MRIFTLITLICTLHLSAVHAETPLRILVMGDSLMTSNGAAGSAVPTLIKKSTGAQVKSKAVTGARFAYKMPLTGALGMNISKQYKPGVWDYVVMNGGGNDLWLGCGCTRCKKRLNKLITPDGRQGKIPTAVQKARQTGAQVIYVGYLRSPGLGSPIEHCRKVGDALEARLLTMASKDPGVAFVSLADIVPHGDASFHAADMIHPSPKGSTAISQRIVETIHTIENGG